MVQLSVRSHWNLEVNTFATKLHEIILKLSRNLEEEEKLHLKLVLADAEDSVVVNEEGDVGELHGGVRRQHRVVRLHHGGRCLGDDDDVEGDDDDDVDDDGDDDDEHDEARSLTCGAG